MTSLSQFHIRILLNGPQDARPGKNRFAYAESPAKQRRDRDLPDTAHNPNELGRIRILLPVVYHHRPSCPWAVCKKSLSWPIKLGCAPCQAALSACCRSLPGSRCTLAKDGQKEERVTQKRLSFTT